MSRVIGRYTKTPSEVLDYSIQWASLLGIDTIDTSSWAVDGATEVSDTVSVSGAVSTVYISGGTTGTVARLTCTITTTGGRTHERTLEVMIQ